MLIRWVVVVWQAAGAPAVNSPDTLLVTEAQVGHVTRTRLPSRACYSTAAGVGRLPIVFQIVDCQSMVVEWCLPFLCVWMCVAVCLAMQFHAVLQGVFEASGGVPFWEPGAEAEAVRCLS